MTVGQDREIPGVLVALLVASLLIPVPLPTRAEQIFYDRARVIGVKPLALPGQQTRFESVCEPQGTDSALADALERRAGNVRAPDPGLGLVQALREDLRLYGELHTMSAGGECRLLGDMQPATVTRYLVRYEYGGRIYERRMREDPGEWVDVRVRLGTP